MSPERSSRLHSVPLTIRMMVLVVGLVFIPMVPLSAQIPDDFTNLEILQKEIGKRALVNVMRGFASSLGVRCNHCHVGENAETLEGFDFASDEKETKRVARAMMRMVHEVNETLLPESGREDMDEVKCFTCHRGKTNPTSMRDRLLEMIETEGVEASIKEYRALREKHYGRGRYDFGAGPLNHITERIGLAGNLEGALQIISVAIEFNPESDYSHFLKAAIQMRMGDQEGAIASLEKAIEIDSNDWYRGALEKAKKGETFP